MKIISFLIFIIILLSVGLPTNSKQILSIETSDLGPPIPKTLFGIFFEDINHAVDGGLYAELIMNRSFEYTNKLEGWNIQIKDTLDSKAYVDNKSPINKNNTNYLKLEFKSDKSEIVIRNSGYGGILLQKGEKYILSYYVKGDTEFEGTIKFTLEDKRGKLYSKAYILTQKFSKEWKKISTEFLIDEGISEAQFVIYVKGIGNLCLDMISLSPKKTWNGMRIDLVEMLKELKPGFMRFPGGCLVEGDSLNNAYRWKDTIGKIEERKTNRNLWGYHQSYGIGFYEYLLLCEYIGAEPVPIFNTGISCQVRGAEYCSMEGLKEWVQDILDFIEFANGPVSTHWGGIRASLGHPEPFKVKYIGIGNENWGEEYHKRFQVFWKTIKEKYPEIKIIFSGPPSYEGSAFRQAWNFAREIGVDIFDEHIYTTPEWFLANSDRYSKYPREGPKVMVGEYAAHTVGRRNNLQSALAEAVFMTELEKNSDVVIMASYAPLFNRISWSQWVPDLIWFDNTKAFGTSNYYVQKIFSENRGDFLLKSSLTEEQLILIGYKFKSLYHVCSYDSNKKEIIIKVVNPWVEDRSIRIDIKGKMELNGDGKVIEILSKNPLDENYFDDIKIFPREKEIKNLENSFVYNFKAYSITILRLKVSNVQ